MVSLNLYNFAFKLVGLTSLSIGGSPPASRSNTFQSGFSDNLLAKTPPADPAPTMMKSYVKLAEM